MFLFVHAWLMLKLRVQPQDGCPPQGSVHVHVHGKKNFHINIHRRIISIYSYSPTSSCWPWPYLHSVSVCFPESIRVLCEGAVFAEEDWNGEQVEKHPPLWWGPWSGSRSARACVGCTVMSWQWSAETAAQPRPPRARHRTWARRPSASQSIGERNRAPLTWSVARDKSLRPGSMDLFTHQRNIDIVSWLNQRLTSKLRCMDLHLLMLWTQWPWIFNDCSIDMLCTDERPLSAAIVIIFCRGGEDNMWSIRTNVEYGIITCHRLFQAILIRVW